MLNELLEVYHTRIFIIEWNGDTYWKSRKNNRIVGKFIGYIETNLNKDLTNIFLINGKVMLYIVHLELLKSVEYPVLVWFVYHLIVLFGSLKLKLCLIDKFH